MGSAAIHSKVVILLLLLLLSLLLLFVDTTIVCGGCDAFLLCAVVYSSLSRVILNFER